MSARRSTEENCLTFEIQLRTKELGLYLGPARTARSSPAPHAAELSGAWERNGCRK